MQQPASGAKSHATDFASRDTECSNFAPGQLNPNAPAFHPNQPNFWTQQKSGLYGKQALLLGKETPAAHFLVWFLCPGDGFRRCLFARRATLFDDVTVWRDRLIFAWRDYVIQGPPVEIHAV